MQPSVWTTLGIHHIGTLPASYWLRRLREELARGRARDAGVRLQAEVVNSHIKPILSLPLHCIASHRIPPLRDRASSSQ